MTEQEVDFEQPTGPITRGEFVPGPQDVDAFLLQMQEPEQDLACIRCKTKYRGVARLPLCPVCETSAGEKYLTRLQNKRWWLQQALADINAQITGMVSKLRENGYVPPKHITELSKCVDCAGWLHFGYTPKPGGLPGDFWCKPCGLRHGIIDPALYQQAEWCHHGYPLAYCRPCRVAHSARVFQARKLAPKPRVGDRAVEVSGDSNESSTRTRGPRRPTEDAIEI